MKYLLISTDVDLDLQEQVKDAIQDGWVPLGGVSVSVHEYIKYTDRDGDTKLVANEICYCQAMIKD